jgi:hypothetical protein
VVDWEPANREAISAPARALVEVWSINHGTHARRRARARGAQATTRKGPNCVGSGRLLPQLRAGSLPMNRLTAARWRRRDRGYLTGTHTRKNHVGSGRLLPQLRALELPIERAANGHALVNSTAVRAGVCALSLLVHDRRCGFRTSSPAAMRVLGREIVSVIHGVGCRRAPPNIAFAQSPPGIGRKRPSLPGQLPGDRASAVPLQLPQMRPVGRKKKKRSRVRGRVRIPRYANEDFSDG